MNESAIYQKILDGMEKLNGTKLRYISDPNKIIEIEKIDLENNRIEVLRENKTIAWIKFLKTEITDKVWKELQDSQAGKESVILK